MRSIICIYLRGRFSSVGYHLKGCSRVEYLLRIVRVLRVKSLRGWIKTIIQLYCLKAWFESFELVEPQAWD